MSRVLASIVIHEAAFDAWIAASNRISAMITTDPMFAEAEREDDAAHASERRAWLKLLRERPANSTELTAYALHLKKVIDIVDPTDQGEAIHQAFESLFGGVLALSGSEPAVRT